MPEIWPLTTKMDPMSFPWTFFQAHHPHKQKKYLLQFRPNGSNKIPIKTSRQKRSFQVSTVPWHLAIRCISRRHLGHCWIQWPRGQKVPAVVIFPRSITSIQYTTPLQATLTSTSKHCISSSKLQAAWPFGGHGSTGHPSTGGAFGENDAMLWGAIIGWEPRFPYKTAQSFRCISQIHCRRFWWLSLQKIPFVNTTNHACHCHAFSQPLMAALVTIFRWALQLQRNWIFYIKYVFKIIQVPVKPPLSCRVHF